MRWDSRPDEESKAALERGNNFHLMAHRYFLGVDLGLNENVNSFEKLNRWVLNLKEFFSFRPESRYFPEHTLRTNVNDLRLEANFDLIVEEAGYVTIWDWKTHDHNAGRNMKVYSNRLENSLQTKVYMFTLVERIHDIIGKTGELKGLSMKYWQPDPPQVIIEVKHSEALHESLKSSLTSIIESIQEYDYSSFDKALYSNHCKLCEFNWFCNRSRTDCNGYDFSL